MSCNRDKHWIYVAAHDKYKNSIFPQLPFLVSCYLILHPEKAELYFDKKLKLDEILKHIHITFIRKEYSTLMAAVKSYVEDESNV